MTNLRLTPLVLGLAVAATLVTAVARAQLAAAYTARLSVVPIDLAMAATIAGTGTVSATVAGTRLTINGTFEGLKSPATTARLHRAQRGVRGPTVDLAPAQVRDLQEQRLYIQLSSEKAPDGNLWGWLQPRPDAKAGGKP
jgi:hypothetical protein